MELTPINANASPNTPATFTCSVSCQFSQTHTISWFVGSVSTRRVQQGNEQLNQDLSSRTGLRVDFTTLQRCTSTDPNAQQIEQLRLTTRNDGRTPVQCAALSNGPTGNNHYSQYGLMFVLGKSYKMHEYRTLPFIINSVALCMHPEAKNTFLHFHICMIDGALTFIHFCVDGMQAHCTRTPCTDPSIHICVDSSQTVLEHHKSLISPTLVSRVNKADLV